MAEDVRKLTEVEELEELHLDSVEEIEVRTQEYKKTTQKVIIHRTERHLG